MSTETREVCGWCLNPIPTEGAPARFMWHAKLGDERLCAGSGVPPFFTILGARMEAEGKLGDDEERGVTP